MRRPPDNAEDFKKGYFLDIDADYWHTRVRKMIVAMYRLKSPEKQAKALVEIYTTYLQMTETLIINEYTIPKSAANFPNALFINSAGIKQVAERLVSKDEHVEQFIDWVAGQLHIRDDEYPERRRLYIRYLKECVKGYLEDYELLNAYKHGFRVFPNPQGAEISIGNGSQDMMSLDKYDSGITYYTKEKVNPDDKHSANGLFERTVLFKRDRLAAKALFMSILLNNVYVLMKAHYGTKAKKIPYFDIDKDKESASFGEGRWRSGIFSFAKKAPKGTKKRS